MPSGIPPRLIQTGKSRELPLTAQAAAASLRSLNPDFEYQFFDDAAVVAFIRTEFPQHMTLFENFPYRIQKFDFFRYLAVFRLGGFYFDLDVFLARPLTSLLSHPCVFPFEELTLSSHLRESHGMDWEIGNYAFGAAPGHPFLEAVIENCVRAQKDPAWVTPMLRGIPAMFRRDFEVLNSTGPGLLTRTLAESPGLAAQVTVLFPEDVRDQTSWHQFGNYGVHLMEGSWRERGGFLRHRIANWWEARARRKRMPASIAKGPERGHPARRQQEFLKNGSGG